MIRDDHGLTGEGLGQIATEPSGGLGMEPGDTLPTQQLPGHLVNPSELVKPMLRPSHRNALPGESFERELGAEGSTQKTHAVQNYVVVLHDVHAAAHRLGSQIDDGLGERLAVEYMIPSHHYGRFALELAVCPAETLDAHLSISRANDRIAYDWNLTTGIRTLVPQHQLVRNRAWLFPGLEFRK